LGPLLGNLGGAGPLRLARGKRRSHERKDWDDERVADVDHLQMRTQGDGGAERVGLSRERPTLSAPQCSRVVSGYGPVLPDLSP
jgi:hypothetical protein